MAWRFQFGPELITSKCWAAQEDRKNRIQKVKKNACKKCDITAGKHSHAFLIVSNRSDISDLAPKLLILDYSARSESIPQTNSQ